MKSSRLRLKSHAVNVPTEGSLNNETHNHVEMTDKMSSSTCEAGQSKKHQVTPLKNCNKHAKANSGEDVHSFCTTPKSRFGRITLPDASGLSNPYSLEENQDDLPEITWNFDSPKTEKDLQEAAKTMTIAHLLANLSRFCKDDPKYEKPNQNSSFAVADIKENLHKTSLEAMDTVKRNKAIVEQSSVEEEQFQLPSPLGHGARNFQRRRWRRPNPKMTREVLEILKSLSGEDKDERRSIMENDGISEECVSCLQKPNVPQGNFKKSSIVDSHSNNACDSAKNLDSAEDLLWGENEDYNDSLIVKATQELETYLAGPIQKSPVSQNACSYIPETAECSKNYDSVFEDTLTKPERTVLERQLESDSTKIPKFTSIKCKPKPSEEMIEKEKAKDENDAECLFAMNNNEWDSVFEDDGWYHDFLEASNVQAKISDHHITTGKTDEQTYYTCTVKQKVHETAKNCLSFEKSHCSEKNVATVHVSDDYAHGRSSGETKEVTDAEMEFFNDESLLNDPEVLTLLDKIESQSAPKCCDKEIALKREAALRKLRERTKSKDFSN